MTPTVYFVCFPDTNAPIGGVKQIYRQCALLNDLGVSSFVLHQEDDFRVSWFEHDTPAIGLNSLRARGLSGDRDILVFPETWNSAAANFAPGVGRVFFNQNAYYSFGVKEFNANFAEGYSDEDVFFHLFVSHDNEALIAHCFRLNPESTGVFRNGIDCARFNPRLSGDGHKLPQVCYMTRKNPDQVAKVINICRQRGLLERHRFVALNEMPEADVARHMAESILFLSFEYPAGSPLPPAEAMASGCVVIGYHGQGGAEYFLPAHSHPIAFGDLLAFARTTEALLTQAENDPQSLIDIGLRARAYIEMHHSLAAEKEKAIVVWNRLFAAWNRWKVSKQLTPRSQA